MARHVSDGVLGVGIIGLNARTERQIVPGFAAVPGATVVALCSRDSQKAERVAATLPGCRAFTDLGAFLRTPGLDVVFVGTPPDLHAPMARQALEMHKAVICEKPLATRADDAVALAQLAAREGMPTAVNFTYRDVSALRNLERALRVRPIGRLLHADLAYYQGRALLPGARIGNLHFEIGSHLVDALLWLGPLAGANAVVSAIARTTAEEEPTFRLALLEMDNGALITYRVSKATAGRANAIEVDLYGTVRSYRLAFDTVGFVLREADWERPAESRLVEPAPDLDVPYSAFPAFHFGRLLEAIRSGAAFPDFAHAARVQAVLDALQAAELSGRASPVG
ncbi:MAG: Gfo/Idh/MocA family oxidoreductase [Chloroflexi bacterium]|nr:Gfo/Idh/MocA family oxidoreductase [Chloroflexota bacterium]